MKNITNDLVSTTENSLLTTTQIFRKLQGLPIEEATINSLANIEKTRLRLAYLTGRINEVTFDEWYESTFNIQSV
jgi:hypothetical protein